MRTLSFVFALGIAMGLALSVPPAHAGKPSSPFGLELMKLGERVRPLQADGGGLMLFTSDAGIATATVVAGHLYYVENVVAALAGPCFICNPNPEGATWDGGCSSTPSDPNYGASLALDGGRFIIPSSTTLKAVPGTGTSVCVLPLSLMR